MESILKMAFLRLSIRPPEPYIFAIFKPAIFKFRIFIGNYIRINETFGFFDSSYVSFEIGLELGSSQGDSRVFSISLG
jgi:hypothetical protein